MLYCPKCGSEYNDDVTICTDCDVDLVSEVPPEVPEEYLDEEWVELYTFSGTLYAQMAVEMLLREGIPAYSKSLFAAAGLGLLGGADYVGANASVYVLEPDFERAELIIEAMTSENPDVFDDETEE